MAKSREVTDHLEHRKGLKREFACGTCGYGIVVLDAPPVCPMCRSSAWELVGREAIQLRALA